MENATGNPDPAEEKAALRKRAAKHRAMLAEQHPQADSEISKHARSIFDLAGDEGGPPAIAAYLPIRSELSPLMLVSALHDRGCVTAMPVTPSPGNPLVFREWAPGDPLDDGPYGTHQPPASRKAVIPQIILAPLLAFDARSWRLGYGGGFYDRTLAALRDAGHAVTVLGVAYEDQKLDSVPTGPYDMPLDGMVTPAGLWLAGNTSGTSSGAGSGER